MKKNLLMVMASIVLGFSAPAQSFAQTYSFPYAYFLYPSQGTNVSRQSLFVFDGNPADTQGTITELTYTTSAGITVIDYFASGTAPDATSSTLMSTPLANIGMMVLECSAPAQTATSSAGVPMYFYDAYSAAAMTSPDVCYIFDIETNN